MSDTCANPLCSNEVPVIGVCLRCADGGYNPKSHGVEYAGYQLGEGKQTGGVLGV